jgi:Spy/CpxP family protein refolding chaperone
MRSQTTAIFLATLMVMATPAAFAVAQTANSNAGLEGGQDSLFDAILATPNRKTPIPQDNASATAPGLEQATPTRKIEAPQGRK